MNTQVEARRLDEMQPDSCSHALLPEEARCQLLPLTPAVASFPSPTSPRSSKGSGVSPGSGLSVVAGAPTFPHSQSRSQGSVHPGWRLASHPACTHRRQASSETAHGLKWTPQRGGRGSSDITFPPEHISDGCSLFTSGKDGFLKDVSQWLEAFLFLYLFLSKN